MSTAPPLILGNRPAQELVRKVIHESHRSEIGPFQLCDHEIIEFPDTEVKPRIECNVRGRHVVVIAAPCMFNNRPVDTALRELYLLNDALGRASVGEVTVIMSYFPYARQDRKDEGRTSVSASVIVRELENSLDFVTQKRVVTIDLHNPAIEGNFRTVPVNPLTAMTEMVPTLVTEGYTVMLAPDTGGAPRTEEAIAIIEEYYRDYAQQLGKKKIRMAMAYKRRHNAEKVDIPWVVGTEEIKGHNVAMLDDMTSTGGTATEHALTLRHTLGARKIAMCTTHPVCANEAWKRLGPEVYDLVLMTDTLPTDSRLPDPLPPNWRIIPIAPLLVSAIEQIHTNGSLTSLWKRRPPLPSLIV